MPIYASQCCNLQASQYCGSEVKLCINQKPQNLKKTLKTQQKTFTFTAIFCTNQSSDPNPAKQFESGFATLASAIQKVCECKEDIGPGVQERIQFIHNTYLVTIGLPGLILPPPPPPLSFLCQLAPWPGEEVCRSVLMLNFDRVQYGNISVAAPAPAPVQKRVTLTKLVNY